MPTLTSPVGGGRRTLIAFLALACAPPPPQVDLDPARHVVRINQVGYLPASPKVAVLCSLDSVRVSTFSVETEDGRRVLGPADATAAPGFGPCVSTHRLDFSALREEGRYRIVALGARSPV
ncbi:MAG: hypothetical protein M3125_09735, partial [Gemmatimonadota bacterium]|nr:hypothetical protein [Gemmatimonadota bacterium]